MTTITPAMAKAGAEAIRDALRFSAEPTYLARKAYRAMESARRHPPRPEDRAGSNDPRGEERP